MLEMCYFKAGDRGYFFMIIIPSIHQNVNVVFWFKLQSLIVFLHLQTEQNKTFYGSDSSR